MSKVSPETKVLYTEDFGIMESENYEDVREMDGKSDVGIVVVGELSYVREFWTLRDIIGPMVQPRQDRIHST